MVSREKIVNKFNQLDQYLELLKKISSSPSDEFLQDKILIGSARYYLQVSIECCLDVANHIIASERFRAPRDYADSFRVIAENEIVSADLGRKLQKMAKFRNRLVHLYGEIDDLYVHDFIITDIKDIEAFRNTVIDRFADQSGS